MLRHFNPEAIAPPMGPYTHGVEVSAGARLVVAAGQVGVRPDGSVPEDLVEQNECIWDNIRAVLADAGMDLSDIVRMTVYVVSQEAMEAFREVRGRVLADPPPASTLIRIAGLAMPELKVEIEVIAAKA